MKNGLDRLFFGSFLVILGKNDTNTSTKAEVTQHDFGQLRVEVWTCWNMLYSMANYLQGRIWIKIDFFLEHWIVVECDSRFEPCC